MKQSTPKGFNMKSLCVALLFFSSAASAQQVPVAASAAAPTVAVEKPKLICEKQVEMGSRLAAKRICATKEQWAQRRADEQLRAQRSQAGGNSGAQ